MFLFFCYFFWVYYDFLTSSSPLAQEPSCMATLHRWDLWKSVGSLEVLWRCIRRVYALNWFKTWSTGKKTTNILRYQKTFLFCCSWRCYKLEPFLELCQVYVCEGNGSTAEVSNDLVMLPGHLKPFFLLFSDFSRNPSALGFPFLPETPWGGWGSSPLPVQLWICPAVTPWLLLS